MAAPFLGKRFTFTQPDGTKIQLRGWGNQYSAVFETLDGYTVVKNPSTGFYEIAQLSQDKSQLQAAPGSTGNLDGSLAGVPTHLRISREATRTETREKVLRMGGRRCEQRRKDNINLTENIRFLGAPALAPPQRQIVGDFVGLCLLIDFVDEPRTITREEVEKFCNQPGYSGFGNNGSVYDYFLDNSNGRCRYTNIVTDYYRAKNPKSYYTDPNIAQGTRARQLIVEALSDWQAKNFDFTPLSADSGGYVYALNVFYAGDVENEWGKGLWPHASSLSSPILLAPGKSVFDYQITDISNELTLRTFCHENGHMLCDYPDLYDYDDPQVDSVGYGVGHYCLMCYGGDNKNPTQISAYLKRLSGWAQNVTPIQHNQQISLSADKNEFAIFAKNSREYFILENRTQSGRDRELPDKGLTIWHVDETGNNDNDEMAADKHYELSLEQADGNFDLERAQNSGEPGDLYGQVNKKFTDSTVPSSKWWNGVSSGLEITDISAPGTIMKFKTMIAGGLKMKIEGGASRPQDWELYKDKYVKVEIDTSQASFSKTPMYLTSLHGERHHWLAVGATSVYSPTPTGFNIYLRSTEHDLDPKFCRDHNWHIEWVGIEI